MGTVVGDGHGLVEGWDTEHEGIALGARREVVFTTLADRVG
jgi:hypothetical protein